MSRYLTSLLPVDSEKIAGHPFVAGWLGIKPFIDRFFVNRYFLLAQFVIAALVIVTGNEVRGAVAFFWLILAELVICSDILAPLFPLSMMSVFLTKCYNSADVFLDYLWLAGPLAAAVVFHLLVYRHKWRVGMNFWGLAAVALAVTLGGLGTITPGEYFNATSLYYVGFLGAGMLAFYLVVSAYLRERTDYNIFDNFAMTLYAMGALACFAVLFFYYPEWDTVKETRMLVEFQSSNNLATMLMIAMPFPCYFALKRRKHLLGLLLIYICIILSGSRGGLAMGTVELLFCLVYLCITDRENRFMYVCLTLAASAVLYAGAGRVLSFYGIDSVRELVSRDEARYGLLERMMTDFSSNILFGRGLGYSGNSDIYTPVKGAMHWYHMMIPQIVGSLGLIGIISYFANWIIRALTVFRRADAYKLVLGVSYLGLFLMSQVNPGEFCPVPYALIAVLIFAVLEEYGMKTRDKQPIEAEKH